MMLGMDRHASNGSLARFRLDYPNLNEHVKRFGEWLAYPHRHGARLRPSTARVYTSAVRSVLVKVMVCAQTPSEAAQVIGAPAITAWRLFLAFTARGGLIGDGTPGGSLYYEPPPGVLPEAVAQLLRRHTRTALGDHYTKVWMAGHIRCLWRYARPDSLGYLPLGALLRREPSGLYSLAINDLDGPELPSRFRGAPVQPDLESAVYLALWSHAGTTPDLRRAPLFTAAPVILNSDAPNPLWDFDASIPTPAPNAIWDVCGRPAGRRATLPPEGVALLAGEAVDLSGVMMSYKAFDGTMFAWGRAANYRWTGCEPLTPEEVEEEHREVLAFHDPRPPPRPEPPLSKWMMQGVNLVGVPPLDPTEPTEPGSAPGLPPREAEATLTAREDVPGGPMPTPMAVPDMETPPPAEPAEAFDNPEWPPG